MTLDDGAADVGFALSGDGAGAHDFRAVVAVTSFPATLRGASDLIALADGHGMPASVLRGAASVMLAAALAQFVDTALDNLAKLALLEFVDADGRGAAQLREAGSLRQKIVQLPRLLSSALLELDPSSKAVHDLHGLLSLRNRLVHVSEPARALSSGDDDLTVLEEHAIVLTPVPRNPWLSVDREHVNAYRAATTTYLEVMCQDPITEASGRGLLRTTVRRRERTRSRRER